MTRIELSVDACAMIETAVSFMLAQNEASHEYLLREGVPSDDEVMTEDAKAIGTLVNLLAVLRLSVAVYVVLPDP